MFLLFYAPPCCHVLPYAGDHEVSEHKLAAWFAAGSPPDHGEKELPKEEALDQLIRDKLVELGRKTEYEVKNMHVHGLRDELAGFDRERREELIKRSEEIFIEERRRRNSESVNRASYDVVRVAIDQRKRSLETYGPGQQDHGDELIPNPPQSRVQHVWDMMTWITAQAPKPMENIWYESKELIVKLREIAWQGGRGAFWPPFPRLESWFRIAGDIASQRDAPLLLSVLEFKRYALRIASTSALVAYNPHEYCTLAKSVYDLGIMARWIHGWSGRLSCYSSLWTPGNVGMSLLGGLTLLAIRKNVASDDDVRCLLVGIASENIMARYMPDKVRAARTEELATRYSRNQGKTCRGSGVKCVRLACEKLGLSRSASQLDGCVAFAVGWAKEAVDGLPGSQKPRDGNDHGQIEDIFCSSRAYRFTDERL